MTRSQVQLIRSWMPPVITRVADRFRRYGYFGNYRFWEAARQDSSGYDAPDIVAKVRDAVLAVKNGTAAAERDSVLFDHIEYSWPLLASLLWIASREDNRLNLLDYGGSLGSSYFQNRQFLAHLNELHWHIVEQPCFVSEGRRYFEDEILRFHSDIAGCLAVSRPKTVLLASVLPYLEQPHAFLETEIIGRFQYVIIDRTGFVAGEDDRLTVQRVNPSIYRASYPAWFFSEQKLLRQFASNYELLADFHCSDRANIPAEFKGFLFKLRGC